MGGGDEGTPTKSSKPTSTPQEAPATPSYPDWSNSMQAFYGAGATPPFFAPTVASPTPHPYMWGGQHPLMPPYGTPVPYQALYPPAGVYAHPNMAATPGAVHGTVEFDGKATGGKDRISGKKAKGASGNQGLMGGRSKDGGKTASGSGNDVGARSAESGSEYSSDASDDDDDDNNNQEFSATRKGSFDQMLADGANAQNNAVPANFHTSIPGNPVASMHATNLNIGMDLWNASPASSGRMKLRPNPPGVSASVAPSGMMNDQWVQVLLGSMGGALSLMTILSVIIGRIFHSVPAQFQTTLPIGEYAAVALLMFFCLKSIKDAWDLPSTVAKTDDQGNQESDEFAEAEELVKEKASNRLSNPLEVLWKSFSLIFFAEWGDRSMLATIALGAAQSPWGVASGAITGHLLATLVAIVGGAFLSRYISEKLVGFIGGALFLVFAFATLLGVF